MHLHPNLNDAPMYSVHTAYTAVIQYITANFTFIINSITHQPI